MVAFSAKKVLKAFSTIDYCNRAGLEEGGVVIFSLTSIGKWRAKQILILRAHSHL